MGNADKLPKWFSVMLVPKLLLTPIKVRLFGQKMAKFGPKSAFLVILGQILPFFSPFVQFLTGGFSVMWVTKLLISPVKKRIFCPKTTKFDPKLAFLVNLGQAMQAYSVPCWWVGWWLWRAGCISQDTYLLYVRHFCLYIFCDQHEQMLVVSYSIHIISMSNLS